MTKTKKTQMSRMSSRMQTLTETKGHLCKNSRMVLLFEKSKSLKLTSARRICSFKAQFTELLLTTIIIPPRTSPALFQKAAHLEVVKKRAYIFRNLSSSSRQC